MKRIFEYRTAEALLVAGMVIAIGAGTLRLRAQQAGVDDLDLVQLRPDFYMIAGAGGNIAVQIGPAGVILVDTGSTEMSDRTLAALKRLTAKPIRT